jgi:hypothetical protein
MVTFQVITYVQINTCVQDEKSEGNQRGEMATLLTVLVNHLSILFCYVAYHLHLHSY